MKNVFLLLLVLISYSCATTKTTKYDVGKYYQEIKSSEPIHVPKFKKIPTAANKLSYPFLYINGYEDYKIKKSKYVKNNNTNLVNELHFYATHSSFYTRKVMYDAFNNWDKNLFINNQRTPMLIWEKVKLLPNRDEKFYVVAGGYENTTSMKDTIYSSISVLDSKGNDCLTNKTPILKKEIIQFFSNGIKNLNTDPEFYSKFWGLILKKKDKK